jgi:hypothetical protein
MIALIEKSSRKYAIMHANDHEYWEAGIMGPILLVVIRVHSWFKK